MSDDDKPFECPENGCGMRFTNEDHLSVHLRKHDLSLALNLGSVGLGLSPIPLFPDQTPTPTKFLKNCEEIGLFQELNANKHINPFEYSFKRALEPGEEEGLLTPDIHVPIPGPVSNDLDTPVPPNASKPETPGDDDGKSATKSSLSSILPKKRKKYLSQTLPTSTTSDNEEEVVSASATSPDIVPLPELKKMVVDTTVSMVTSSTTEQKPDQSPVTPAVTCATMVDGPKSVIVQPSQPAMMQVLVQLRNGQSVAIPVPIDTLNKRQPLLLQPTPPVQPIVKQEHPQLQGQQLQPMQQIKTIPIIQNIPNVLATNHVPLPQTVQTVPVNFIPTNNVPSVQNTPRTVQHIPINVPVNLFPTTVTPGPSPLSQTGAQMVIPQNSANQSAVRLMSPENPTVSTSSAFNPVQPGQHAVRQALKLPTTVQGSQVSTKMKLKEALQQQTSPASTVKINQIFAMKEESANREHTKSVTDSSPSMVSNSDSSMSPDDSNIPFKHFRYDDSQDPEDSKRLKFLERNRAAAARCRQKRKNWVGSLEKKSDDLININSKLQSEVKLLRGEVAELKCLLLAHKDCPVTRQQKSQQATAESPVPQTVPNAAVVSPAKPTSRAGHPAATNGTSTPQTVNSSVPQTLTAGLPHSVMASAPETLLSGLPQSVVADLAPSVVAGLQQTLVAGLTQASAGSPTVASSAPQTYAIPQTISVPQTVMVGQTMHAMPQTIAVPQTITVPQTIAVPQNIIVGVSQNSRENGAHILPVDVENETQDIFTSVFTGPNSVRFIPSLVNNTIVMTEHRS